MSLDPDIVAQLNDNMRLMNETMGVFLGTMASLGKQTKNNTSTEKNSENAIRLGTVARQNLTKAELAAIEAEEKEAKVRQQQTQALRDSGQALKSFAGAILNSERSFSKYNDTLENAGNAALELGKSFGIVGTILGGIIKGATMLGSAFAKQADNVLKATDDLSKFGTAGQLTAEEVRKMGANVGYTSEQLDKLVKPIQSIGAGLINLGGTAAEGAKAFGEIANVGKDTRMQYQRLGVSQAELTQAQADYIKLQQVSGQQITKSNKDLQKSSLAYVDNLLTLAALTGQDIESVKRKNEIAMSEIETKLQNNLLDQEISRLKKSGTEADKEKLAQLEKEKEARDKLLQRVENEVGDPMLRKGLAKFMATGAITEEIAALKRIGVPIEQFAARIKKGEDVSGEFMDSLQKSGDAAVKNVGYSAMFSEETRKAFGLSTEMLEFLAKTRGKEAKVREDAIKEAMGTADTDPAQIARNQLTELEIEASIALENMVASMNPLLTGFEDMDVKLKVLIGAVIAATVALGAMSAAALARAAGKLIGPKTAGPTAGAGGVLKGGARVLGKVAAPLAIGMAGYDAFQGFRADKDAPLSERLKNAGSSALSGLSFGLLGSSAEEIRNRKGQEQPPVATERESKDTLEEKNKDFQKRERELNRKRLNLERMTEAERNQFERDIFLLGLEKAQNEEKLQLIELERTDLTPIQKQAAKELLEKAKKNIELNKLQMATIDLAYETDAKEKVTLGEKMMAAKRQLAQLEITKQKELLQKTQGEKEKELIEKRIKSIQENLKTEIQEIATNTGASVTSAAATGAGGTSSGQARSRGRGATPAGTSPSTTKPAASGGILSRIGSALGFGGSDSGANAAKTTDGATTEPPAGKKGSAGSMSEQDIKQMIIDHEGIRYEPYQDSLGKWTTGVGHLIGDGSRLLPEWNRTLTHDEVMDLFDKDYDKHKKQAEQYVPGFQKYDSVGQAAFIDLTFNMGPGWPRKFVNTSKKIEQGDTFGAARGLEDSLWYRQVGRRAPKIVDMVENAKVQARDGGLATGPTSGYPATLHGSEMIVPLDPNSILAELGKKSQTQIQSEIIEKTSKLQSTNPEVFNQIADINKNMMEMLAHKLDNMISKLDTSNDIQDKLLKYSQV